VKQEKATSAFPRWRVRLEKELAHVGEFESLDEAEWASLLRVRSVTSRNHDTVLSLDWPHYCAHSTPACGGPEGWCYTFQGNQASIAHNRHAAMVDQLAINEPALFARTVRVEVEKAVASGQLAYPNLRLAGSGETIDAYVPALAEVVRHGVRVWGFTRNIRLAERLREAGVAVIVSCDRTSPPGFVERVTRSDFPIAYTSTGVDDHPPAETLVTFPVHRVGRVREVVDAPTLCPKVLADFLDDSRPEAFCQRYCQRCHLNEAVA
jgi:hypothetical protein